MIKKTNTNGKTFEGSVISDKMTNTIVVSLEYTRRHPLYKKIVRKHKNIYA
ncbi:MAG: 30S ribosomal protein S17, partial [Candidatus Shapirobacteria bacterium]|nr:30S ribosomal protein S17 [Candidatus Shapirobacteria bacterium]